MLVSNWAQNYWAVSTVAKKTLYDYKNVFGRVVEPFIGSKDLDEVSLMDIQKLVLATTPYQARLALMIIKTLYREAKLYGMTEKNPTIGVKLPKRPEPKRVFLTWDQVNALDWGRYNDQVRFLALHGLRWSEAVALTEQDISDGYVSVNKSFYGSTKSASSNRKVPYIVKLLRLESNQHANLNKEIGDYKRLIELTPSSPSLQLSVDNLMQVNLDIWDSMTLLYEATTAGEDCTALTLEITALNQKRAFRKRSIDVELKSTFTEEKSYFSNPLEVVHREGID